MKNKQLAEITWLDATAYDRVGLDTDKKMPGELLMAIKSYGFIHREDKDAIILAYEDSDDERSFVVIPKKWIKDIKTVGKVKGNVDPTNCVLGAAKGKRKSRFQRGGA